MRFTIDHCFMLSTSSGAGSGEFAWIGILKIILLTINYKFDENTSTSRKMPQNILKKPF